MPEWHAHSWEAFRAAQQPDYEDTDALRRIVSELRFSGEPVVDTASIERLLAELGKIAQDQEGKIFVHAGDCAETFDSCTQERVMRDANFLSSIGSLTGGPLVIGRICGQFGKPRSSPLEDHPIAGSIPVFRGDIINSANHDDRTHDPSRMVTAHRLSREMMNVLHSNFPDIYTSHECLLLPYESALVRSVGSHAYNTSAHFLWIGDRTRGLRGAHVEFCRGIRNPIGIKVSHTANPREIVEIVTRINPDNVPGKVTIITRFGASNQLDELIREVRDSGCAPVVWQCDPMHGNTIQIARRKTRRVDDIKREISHTIESHQRNGTKLHGIHLETTGADVTECIGCGVEEGHLENRYMSACDPRLNPIQTNHVLEFVNELLDGTCTPMKPSIYDRLTTCTTASASPSSSKDAPTP
jgi:3-deoxy-7-phosphoheptulonate synthase